MNKFRTICNYVGFGLLCVLALGCGPQAVIAPAYQDQPVMSSTCINNNTQQVLPDNYCDSNYLSQQRAIAQQNHDSNLLATLMLYNYIYTPNPYAVGYYIPRTTVFYRSRPSGYSIMPRATYYSGYTNHTIIINNGRAVNRSYTTSTPRSSSGSSYTRSSSTTSTPSRSSSSSTYSRPSSSSYSSTRSSSSSYSSSSSSRRR